MSGSDGDGWDGERRGEPLFGQTWAYESIVGGLPWLSLSTRQAVLVQFALFEAAVVAVAVAYDRPGAVVPGTVAVTVAAGGSAFMLDLADRIRYLDLPDTYRRLLFGTSLEVVLSVVAYAALVGYLFVVDPRDGAALLPSLVGSPPAYLPTVLALLVLWDVCYRIGTGWWAAVVALWRSRSYDVDADTAAALERIDRRNALFGLLQLGLLPLLAAQPLLFWLVVGHVLAVVAATGASILLLRS